MSGQISPHPRLYADFPMIMAICDVRRFFVHENKNEYFVYSLDSPYIYESAIPNAKIK